MPFFKTQIQVCIDGPICDLWRWRLPKRANTFCRLRKLSSLFAWALGRRHCDRFEKHPQMTLKQARATRADARARPCTHAHSRTSLTHPRTHLPTHSLSRSLAHPPTHSLNHVITPSLGTPCNPPTHPRTPLNHSAWPLSHSLTLFHSHSHTLSSLSLVTKANETSHIVFPNRDSEWGAVLERAVHNDCMYGALDASRAAGRIDQEYINPRDRKSTPWGDQQWNMKKVASEAAHIPLGMRQDIQAKYIMDEHLRGTGQICPIGMITWFVVLLVTRTAGRMIVFERRE